VRCIFLQSRNIAQKVEWFPKNRTSYKKWKCLMHELAPFGTKAISQHVIFSPLLGATYYGPSRLPWPHLWNVGRLFQVCPSLMIPKDKKYQWNIKPILKLEKVTKLKDCSFAVNRTNEPCARRVIVPSEWHQFVFHASYRLPSGILMPINFHIPFFYGVVLSE